MRKISIKVKPNAKRSELTEMEDGTWKAFLKSPPVDGKANEELIRLLSKSFGCPKSMIKISKGSTSSYKQILIED